MGSMRQERWKQAEDQFHLALEKSASERILFLNGLDEDLRLEVAALIEAYEASEAAEAAAATRERAPAPAPPEPLIEIGQYTVIRQLGEGGMGAVYLAERADAQFEKRVAIKLIRPGPGAHALMERFYKERQILAGLEHAYIARLLDGGTTPDGQPFLVMEYVDGERLDNYCDDRKLDVRARLELFRKVCTAVNYAHQRLIVHRDLKPNNIMVTAEGEPKLLDFGVAKVTKAGPREGDTAATVGMFFTPLYASPEMLSGQPTTVSSDVYSLGVILYDTLTGRLPHAEHAMSPGALISAVITGDPQRPSTSAGQPLEHEETPDELAAKRGVTREKLQKILRGDLDGIVLRSLAKNPAERYASVEQLADDIERYLTGRPVLAVEATAWYAARKFVQRHKLGVVAAGLFVLSLVGGLAGTLWQASVARRQTAEANLRFNDARMLANYLLFDLYASVKKLPGSTPVQAEMADRTLTYLDKLASAKSEDRALQVELARGYLQLGDVLGNPFGPNLGQTKRSLEVYRKGLAMIEPVAAAGPHDKQARITLARMHQQLAGAQTFQAKPAELIQHARQASTLFDGLVQAHPDDVEVLLSAGLSDQFLARNLSQRTGWIGKAKEGDEVFTLLERSAVRIRRALEIEPGQGRAYRMLAGTLQARGNVRGGSEAAIGRQDHREAIAVLDQQSAAERDSVDGRKVRASILLNLAWGLGTAKEYTQSQAVLKEAKQVLQALADTDPNDMAALYQVAIPLRTAGIFHARADHPADAVASFQEEIEILDRLIAKDAGNRIYQMYRAEARVRGGAELAKMGKVEEARRMGQPGLAYYEGLADDPAANLQALIEAARWRTQPPAPLRDFRRGLAYARRADALSKGTSWEPLESMAVAQWGLGQREEAVATMRRILTIVAAPAPGQQPSPLRAELQRTLDGYIAKSKAK